MTAAARPVPVSRRRTLRPGARALAVLVVLAVAAGGAWTWFRDSSLVAVKDVYVLGLSSSDENRIRTAIKNAALDMTTLHVRHDQLQAAVAAFPSVKELKVTTDFPREMTIEVVERHPVAVVESGGRRVAVGAGGLLMRGLRPDPALPTVRMRGATGANGRLTDGRALAAVSVLGGAPEELRERTEYAFYGPRGLTLDLEDGPRLIFGNDRQVAAKWAAATRVLADKRASGATYLDVRVPERVAAGGLHIPTPTPAPQVTAAAAGTVPQTVPVNPQPGVEE